MSTRPREASSSRRTGTPNVRPASFDSAAKLFGLSSFALNHAIATFLPLALSAGPLTGQAGTRQPSAPTDAELLALLQRKALIEAELETRRRRRRGFGYANTRANQRSLRRIPHVLTEAGSWL